MLKVDSKDGFYLNFLQSSSAKI